MEKQPNIEEPNYFDIKLFRDLSSCYIGCCVDCKTLIEDFSRIYHQFECLDLQLQWKITKLVDIIKLANKVPSRISQLKTVLEERTSKDGKEGDINDEKLEKLRKFRHKITKKCSLKLTRSQPRVLLNLTAASVVKLVDGPENNLIVATNDEINVRPDNEPTEKNLPVDCNEKTNIENYRQSCDEPVIFEDRNSFSDCDDDPQTFDINEEADTIENNESEAAADENNASSKLAFSPAAELPEATIYTHEQGDYGDPHPQTNEYDIFTTPPFPAHSYLKTEMNVGESTITAKNSTETYFHLEDENSNVAPTQTINEENNDQLSQICENLEQVSESGNISFDLQNQDSTSFDVELASNTSQPKHDADYELEKNNENVDKVEPPQKRYNLRRKPVPKFSQISEEEFSHTNDSEQEFSDTNSSHSSSSNSFSDSESKNDILPNFGINRRRKRRKPKSKNEPLSKSKEILTISCPHGCQKIFQNKKIYQNHQKLHSAGEFPCNFCKDVLTSVLDLANHEYKEHPPKDFNTDQEKQCPRCNLKFNFPFDYEEHFAYAHFGMEDIFDDSLPKMKKYKCWLDGCHKLFLNQKLYRDHLKLHSEGHFPCKFCKTVASSVINLAYHEQRKHCKKSSTKTKEKQCPRCPLKFKYSFDYEDHFAYTHFGIGENPETKPKRRERGQPIKNSICPPNEFQNMPIITCEICKEEMPSNYKPSHMKKYHKTTDETKMKICKQEGCQAYFLTDKQLRYHSKSHREQNTTFCCHLCKRSFSGRLLLRRHMRQKHNQTVIQKIGTEYQEKKLECKFCEFKTNIPRDLTLHEEDKHGKSFEDEDEDGKRKKRKCPRCQYTYEVRASYILHHLTKHLNVLSENSPNACKLCSGNGKFVNNSNGHFNRCHNTNLLHDPTKIFKCDVEDCPAYFTKPFQLYCHKNKRHSVLTCKKCEKTFKFRSALLHHLRSCQKSNVEADHPNLTVSCEHPTCGIMFQSKEEMEMHKSFAHPQKPRNVKEKNVVCSICDRRFKTVKGLKFHMGRGHIEPSFVCSECGKVFKYKHLMDVHMEFHKGPDAWKFECTECGKKCIDKHKLEEHLRTHTKEKPFICQFCGGKYAHRHNWRNHLKTKHADEKGVDEIVGKVKKGNFMSRKGSKKGECIMAS